MTTVAEMIALIVLMLREFGLLREEARVFVTDVSFSPVASRCSDCRICLPVSGGASCANKSWNW